MSRSALSLLAFGLVACQPARDGSPSLDTSALQGAMPAGGSVGAVFTSPGARPGEELDPYIDETFIQLLEVATASVRVAVDRLDHPGMQEAILEAWDRGLDVQVVADADNNKYSGFGLLEDAGVPVVWQPAGAPEMHNKYVIVDEAVVWTGSLSMTTTELLYNNHASIFLADETLAAVYRSDFDQMFVDGDFGVDKAALGGEIELSIGGARGQVAFGAADAQIDLLVAQIEAARQSVVVAAHTLTHAQVVNALLQAKASGREVVVVLDATNAEIDTFWEQELINGGVLVVRDGNQNSPAEGVGGRLGHQLMLIDGMEKTAGSVLVVSSTPWSQTAVNRDDDNLLVLHNAEIASRYALELCELLAIALPHPTLPGAPDPADAFAAVCAAPAPILRINELLPDPVGTDAGKEFVEIVNMGSAAVDLSGWTLGDAANPARHTFAPQLLHPGQAIVVFDSGNHRSVPGAVNASTRALGMNNNGDTVLLNDPTGAPQDIMTYGRTAAGVSFNRDPDGEASALWVRHDAVDGARGRQSPGKRADGSAW
ncbi:MAG: lamin tail domain-containing protein [Deltaproteobacteria bacterium]|jgi:phosphatidylserine/phosphatidylglycerophosphate/cardiolipin synthase-like enzyme|nr:lamin tail domain-containing protein [Deltaproteobacteria bacterium]